jgi:hypothetical protein
MAGTRGLAKFKGAQLNGKIMRDRHFDVNNKINEQFIDIDFNAHREILEDTKIDVFSQVNNKVVAGVSELDITADLGGKPQATANTEGVVTGQRIDLRVNGSEDFPFIDADGDRVYGKIEFVPSPDGGVTPDKFVLKFFSEQASVEAPYTFAAGAQNMDFRYILRTNMSVIPVDAILKGGAGFVEGATDANAYMNLNQLMKDIYGASGTLDNDGNANLVKDVVTQIADEINARTQADQDILDNFASTADGEGANLVGVEVDASGNYVGTTVQAVLTELAAKITTNQTDLNDRVTKLETKLEEEVYEATGGETSYTLVNGRAEDKSVLLFINGQLQTPGINFVYVKNGSNEITGFDFAPDTLEVVDGVPDVLFIKYNKIL